MTTITRQTMMPRSLPSPHWSAPTSSTTRCASLTKLPLSTSSRLHPTTSTGAAATTGWHQAHKLCFALFHRLLARRTRLFQLRTSLGDGAAEAHMEPSRLLPMPHLVRAATYPRPSPTRSLSHPLAFADVGGRRLFPGPCQRGGPNCVAASLAACDAQRQQLDIRVGRYEK